MKTNLEQTTAETLKQRIIELIPGFHLDYYGTVAFEFQEPGKLRPVEEAAVNAITKTRNLGIYKILGADIQGPYRLALRTPGTGFHSLSFRCQDDWMTTEAGVLQVRTTYDSRQVIVGLDGVLQLPQSTRYLPRHTHRAPARV